MTGSQNLTVPAIAVELGEPLDRVRRVLRERPDLAAMFSVVGATRYLPRERLPELRAALLATRKRAKLSPA